MGGGFPPGGGCGGLLPPGGRGGGDPPGGRCGKDPPGGRGVCWGGRGDRPPPIPRPKLFTVSSANFIIAPSAICPTARPTAPPIVAPTGAKGADTAAPTAPPRADPIWAPIISNRTLLSLLPLGLFPRFGPRPPLHLFPLPLFSL